MMVYKNKNTADSNILESLIIIHEIKVIENNILFHCNKLSFNVWFENINKHIPEVYELKKEAEGIFSFNCSFLSDNFTKTSLKLSVSSDTETLNYSLPESLLEYAVIGDFDFIFKESNGYLVMVVENKNNLVCTDKIDLSRLYCSVNNRFEKIKIKNNPVKLCVIGSCFSRSVFRSDNFFNPGYKRFFTVPLTFFHNSIISLMSNRLEDKDYLQTTDLLIDKAYAYIEAEFLKNVKEQISSAAIEYIIIDNYSDVALEAIEMDDSSILTYNRYFSESIYKRKFSGKEILIPGEIKHLDKYREALRKFYLLLQELNLDKRVVLVGGRLSIFKTQSQLWNSKIDWIKITNRNWDTYDQIFLDEIPSAQYIDMRSTHWISDINSPIMGGASPSHYQSGFYKELYKKILSVIYKE